MIGITSAALVRGGPDEAEVFLMFGFFGTILLMTLIVVFSRQRTRKLKVLEEALRSGAVDSETKRDLLENMMGGRLRVPWMYRAGWFGMFIGAAMLLTHEPDWWNWSVGIPWWTSWLLVTAMSLAGITMPFAVRELQMRRQSQVPGTRTD